MNQRETAQNNQRGTRQAFRLPFNHVPEMKTARRQYVRSYFRLLGFDATDLVDEELIKVFALLARVEEYTTYIRHNGHNWEVDYSSLERLRETTIPVIEIWVRQWVDRGLLKLVENAPPLWPEEKRFALCLTHDMDMLGGDLFWPRLRSLPTFWSAPIREKVIVALSTTRAFMKRCLPGTMSLDPLLVEWMEEEAKHGFKSSFFFLAQPLPDPDWQDSFYRYTDRVRFGNRHLTIAEVVKEMVKNGWDVGLHGSSRSHVSAELLARERQILSEICNQEVQTIRQHHLFYDVRITPLSQARAGFKSDSTLGSNIRAGFRCGTGIPFFCYDLVSDTVLDILEVPLVVQDVAIFGSLQMDKEIALRHCVELMRYVAELGGAMTLLWHNTYYEGDEEFGVYRELLEEADRLGAWGCSVRQLSDWWRYRYDILSASHEYSKLSHGKQ